MIINELLAYAVHYVNASALDNVKRIIQSFYSSNEITAAKKALWDACGNALGKQPERKSTDKRPGLVAHINDIFDALKTLDAVDKLPDVVARNLDRLPDRQPEELNLLMIIQRIAALEKSRDQHNDALSTRVIDILDLMKSESRSYTDALINGRIQEQEDGKLVDDERYLTVQYDEEGASSPTEMTSKTMQDVSGDHKQNHPIKVAAGRRKPVSPPSRPLSSLRENQTRLDASGHAVRHQGTQPGASNVNRGRTLQSKYAGRQVQPDEDGFMPVLPRRKRRVMGNGEDSVPGLEGAPPPLRHIWVSRVQRGSIETISAFIEKQQVKVFHNEKVSHQNAKFSSFKISISKSDLSKVLQDSFWPQGVQCQPWRENTRRNAARRPNTGDDIMSSFSQMDSSDHINSTSPVNQGLASDNIGADVAIDAPHST